MVRKRNNKGTVSTVASTKPSAQSGIGSALDKSSKQKKKSANILYFDEIYENGVIRKGERYSLCYTFSNIDYVMYSEKKKDEVYEKYQQLLNTLPCDMTYQELLINRDFDSESLEKTLLPNTDIMSSKSGEFLKLVADYTEIQKKRIEDCCNNECTAFFVGAISYTPSGKLDSPDTLFQYYDNIEKILNEMNVKTRILTPEEILRIYHDIYQPDGQSDFRLPNNIYRYGMNLSDYVAPSHICTDGLKYIEIGSCFSRVMYIKNFGRNIDDKFLNDMLNHSHKICISKHIRRLEESETDKLLKSQLDAIEGELEKRRELNAKRGTAYIPFRLRDKETEIERVQDKLSGTNCELFETCIFFYLTAESKEELEDLTKFLKTRARKHKCNLDTLTWRQEKGLISILPLANNPFNAAGDSVNYFWLTDELANLIPFSSVDYVTPNGLCYGVIKGTKKLIVIDRTQELNANGLFMGASGSGKSFLTKTEMWAAMLTCPNDEFLIIDPENEYKALIEPFGGTIITVAPESPTHLNLFDTDLSFTDNGISAISIKKEFIMMFVQQVKGEQLTAAERSIVNRCITNVYMDFVESKGKAPLPTLPDFWKELKAQKSDVADNLCDALELYVSGSFDMFAHSTNVEYNNRFILFDISNMGDMLQIVGMQVLLELIWQRVRFNKQRGVRTWLWTDEFSIVLNDENSSKFFETVYQRIRKYGGVASGITQNVSRVLKNPHAVNMLKNSEFVVLLRQKDEDLKFILDNYELSASQIKAITSDEAGGGLIIAGNKVIEFDNRIPKDTMMYKICSTKFGENTDEINAEDDKSSLMRKEA